MIHCSKSEAERYRELYPNTSLSIDGDENEIKELVSEIKLNCNNYSASYLAIKEVYLEEIVKAAFRLAELMEKAKRLESHSLGFRFEE